MRLPPPRHWLVGLTLSLALAWTAGALLLDTVQPVAFDHSVAHYVPLPGTTTRTRAEGWASSSVGEHGLRGLPGGMLPSGPKVVFWGDSYVEGLQVDDAQRMERVLGSLCADAGLALSGVGVGVSGDSLIDSYFRLPAYAEVFGTVALHVFLLAKISDVLPDMQQPGHSTFQAESPYRLVFSEVSRSPLNLRLAPPMRTLELGSVYEVIKRTRSLTFRIHPGPGPSPAASAQTSALPAQGLNAAWDVLLHQLKVQARQPLLLAYAPTLPRPTQGGVAKQDETAATAQAFAEACARNGVPFLNLGPAFLAHYQATGRMPRGFFNSPPGSGHLNEAGHRLVAQAVLHYIEEHHDALLAP